LADPKRYKGRGLAENMEEFLFYCPECGAIDTMTSSGDRVTCKNCGLAFRYNEYGMLEGIPFKTVRELALWQENKVERAAKNGAVYTAGNGTLSYVAKHDEQLVDSGKITMSEGELVCGSTVIPMEDIANMTMHGRRALVFSTPGAYYELIPEKGWNTLKFLMLYQKYKQACATAV